MITGALVLALVVAREVVRPDAARVGLVGRLLVPAAVVFGALLVLRLADLVVGRA